MSNELLKSTQPIAYTPDIDSIKAKPGAIPTKQSKKKSSSNATSSSANNTPTNASYAASMQTNQTIRTQDNNANTFSPQNLSCQNQQVNQENSYGIQQQPQHQNRFASQNQNTYQMQYNNQAPVLNQSSGSQVPFHQQRPQSVQTQSLQHQQNLVGPPIQSQNLRPQLIHNQMLHNRPVQTQLLQQTIIQPQPMQAQPIQSHLLHSQIVQQRPLQHIQPQTAQSQTMQTPIVQTQPAHQIQRQTSTFNRNQTFDGNNQNFESYQQGMTSEMSLSSPSLNYIRSNMVPTNNQQQSNFRQETNDFQPNANLLNRQVPFQVLRHRTAVILPSNQSVHIPESQIALNSIQLDQNYQNTSRNLVPQDVYNEEPSSLAALLNSTNSNVPNNLSATNPSTYRWFSPRGLTHVRIPNTSIRTIRGNRFNAPTSRPDSLLSNHLSNHSPHQYSNNQPQMTSSPQIGQTPALVSPPNQTTVIPTEQLSTPVVTQASEGIFVQIPNSVSSTTATNGQNAERNSVEIQTEMPMSKNKAIQFKGTLVHKTFNVKPDTNDQSTQTDSVVHPVPKETKIMVETGTSPIRAKYEMITVRRKHTVKKRQTHDDIIEIQDE